MNYAMRIQNAGCGDDRVNYVLGHEETNEEGKRKECVCVGGRLGCGKVLRHVYTRKASAEGVYASNAWRSGSYLPFSGLGFGRGVPGSLRSLRSLSQPAWGER